MGADRQGVAPGCSPGAPSRRNRWRPSPARRSGPARWRPDRTDARCARPSSGWTRAARRRLDASPVAPVRVQGYGVDKLARWVRKTGGVPSRSGKDSARPHPVAQGQRAGHLRADAVLPRAEGLAQPAAHRTRRGDVRLDRAALGDRQPRPRRHPLRPRAPAAGRRGAVASCPTSSPPPTSSARCCPDPRRRAGPTGRASRWWPGTPDVQSAAIGSGATGDFQGHLYIGTSSWLTCHVPYKKTDLLRNMASLPSAIPGRYLVADEQETAGGAPRPSCATGCTSWTSYAEVGPPGGTGAAGQRRGALHPLAQRRADPGRGQNAPRRLPQPLACRRRAATWSAPCWRAWP